jgi:hypothetical protein
MALLPTPHESGSVWFTKPSPYGSFIHYTLPVLTGALGTSFKFPVFRSTAAMIELETEYFFIPVADSFYLTIS